MAVCSSEDAGFEMAVEVGRQEAAFHEHPLEYRIAERMQQLRESPTSRYKWLIFVMSALAGGIIGKRIF